MLRRQASAGSWELLTEMSGLFTSGVKQCNQVEKKVPFHSSSHQGNPGVGLGGEPPVRRAATVGRESGHLPPRSFQSLEPANPHSSQPWTRDGATGPSAPLPLGP